MIVRNKIWEEIKHADANAICARRYANVQRRIQLFYLISVPVLSAICVFLAKMELCNETFWTALIILATSIVKAIFPQVILPEKDILKLDKLYQDFTDCYSKLESLIFKFDKKLINEVDAERELSTIQKNNVKRKTELNKLVLWIPKCIDNSITKESERHLKAVFNNEYEQ